MTPPSYIDLHCDTAYELYHQKQGLLTNHLAVSLDAAACYPNYAQFFAVWSDRALSDEQAYTDFLAITDHFFAHLAEPAVSARVQHVRTYNDMMLAWEQGKAAAFVAVEDARLLNRRLERLEELAQRGVKYLTLTWGGISCIGGSHDTERGLTDFGKAVVQACFDLGIVPDVSHASETTTEQVLSIAERNGRPVIASHSNYFSVYPHSRNLRDDHFRRICALGGLVGLNLCRDHLCNNALTPAEETHVLSHLEHALTLGGEHTVAIGGDLDGAMLPRGIQTVADVGQLSGVMAKSGIDQTVIERIFYGNALRFIQANFG